MWLEIGFVLSEILNGVILFIYNKELFSLVCWRVYKESLEFS